MNHWTAAVFFDVRAFATRTWPADSMYVCPAAMSHEPQVASYRVRVPAVTVTNTGPLW